jgi:hypothetical protein
MSKYIWSDDYNDYIRVEDPEPETDWFAIAKKITMEHAADALNRWRQSRMGDWMDTYDREDELREMADAGDRMLRNE